MKTTKMKMPLSVIAVGTAILLSGCAGIHQKVDDGVAKNKTDIENIKSLSVPVATQTPLVSKMKGSWVAEKKPMLEIKKVETLPAVFSTSFINRTPGQIKILDVVTRVSQEKNIQIRMAPELSEMMPGDSQAGSSTVGAASGAVSLPALPSGLPNLTAMSGLGASVGGGVSAPAGQQQKPISIYSMQVSDLGYSGNLSGFLDLLASKLQVSWKYENGNVLFYRYETRVFNVKALAGIGKVKNGVGASTTSSGGASGASASTGAATSAGNSTDIIAESDLWKSVKDSVNVMLTKYGRENFYASAELGTVTISDEPARLDKIGSYLERLNKDLSRQVSLQLAIYNVEISESDTVGVDWNAVWSTAAASYGAKIGGGTSLTTLQKTIGVNILSGPWTGTSAIVGALNTVGKTSLVTRGQIMTMNRQAAPIQIMEEQGYLAKVSVTVNQTSSSTSLEPGTVVTGFSATMTPKIEDDGEILLQFAGGLSDFKGFDKFGAGGNEIQLPKKSLRDFLQRVKIRSGETLVMTGFEQKSDLSNDSGVGNSKNLLLGGSQQATGKRSSLVVVVTPYIVE